MAFFDFSIYGIIYRFAEFAGAPFQNPELLWFGLPLVIALIAIELNFPKKNWEEHDLKQALPNAIILLFISIDLARMVFDNGEGFFATLFTGSFAAAFTVFLLAVAVFLIDYFLEFPRKTFFEFSAHLPINLLAYTLMVVVYNGTGFDINSIFALLLLFALFWVLVFVVKHLKMIPEESKSEHHSRFNFSEPRQKKFDFYPGQSRKESMGGKKNDAFNDSVDLGTSKLKWIKKK